MNPTRTKITDAKITDAKITDLYIESPEMQALFQQAHFSLKALLAAQEEFYSTRPIRRFLKRLGLIPDPDMKARLWALRKVRADHQQELP